MTGELQNFPDIMNNLYDFKLPADEVRPNILIPHISLVKFGLT